MLKLALYLMMSKWRWILLKRIMPTFTAQFHSWQRASNETFSLNLINRVVSKKLNLMVRIMSVTMIRKMNILVGVVGMAVI